MFKRILVPINGSKHAEKALEDTLNLAEKYSANFLLLSIIPLCPVSLIHQKLTSGYSSNSRRLPRGNERRSKKNDFERSRKSPEARAISRLRL